MSEYQIIWRGIVHDQTGYSNASREYLLALDRQGADVKIEPMNFGTAPTQLKEEVAKRINELISKPYADNKKKVLIYHAQPNGIVPVIEKEKYDYVVINTVWETTKVPDNWFPNVNQADAVIVPSYMNIRALQDSGVTVPIWHVSHGADTETFNPDNKPLNFPLPEDVFTFLSVFQWQLRKSPALLLRAFWEEFTNEDKVALLVKTYYGSDRASGRHIMNQIMHYKQSLGFGDNTAPAFLTTSNFSQIDLQGLYALADCYVLPTKGEGVGLPYIEALSTGIPVIATGWGGQMDFLNDSNSYIVDYELSSTRNYLDQEIAPDFHGLFTDEMKWAHPDISSLRLMMRTAYENQEEAKAKGLRGREAMLHMSWDNAGVVFKEALDRLVK